MSQQLTVNQCPSYRQPWKSFISKNCKKLLIIPALLMALLCFSAFSATQAHAASINGQNISGDKVTNSCMVETNVNNSYSYTLILWKDVCTGGYWAGITANVSGTFGLSLYGDGYLLSHHSGYLYPGQYISTPEYSGYSVYSDSGVYYG